MSTECHTGSDILKNLSEVLGELPTRPDNSKLPEIFQYLLLIQYDKEGTYGSSWKGKGEYRGIMSNIDRKYDRLDKITMDEIQGLRPLLPVTPYEELSPKDIEDIGESKIDAVADLTNYCMLYMSYLKEKYPGAFEVWVQKNITKLMRNCIK